MYAQIDQQLDGSWLVTGTSSHLHSVDALPKGRRFVAVPDEMRILGGEIFTPDTPDDISAGGTFIDTPESLAGKHPPRSTRVSKVAFLGVIPPALFKAWATSTDETLMYGKALFDADTSVDITNPAIAAVLTRAVALDLIDAPTAAGLQLQIERLAA